MTCKNILKSIPPYLAVWAGLFLFHNAWVALCGLHVAFLLVLSLSQPTVSPIILLNSKNFKWILFNIIFCGLSGLGIYYLRSILWLSENLPAQLAQLGLSALNLPIFIAYFSLVNPFLEEYFWRISMGSDTKGFYMGDLLYAGYHAIVLINQVPVLVTLFATACLTFIGWFWRQIQREDGGSLAPVLGHVAADFSVMTAIYLIIK